MNDLTELREGWGQPQPPSPAAYSAARASLMQQATAAQAATAEPAQTPVATHTRRPAWAARFQRHRAGWLAGTAGLTAAAAVAVATVMGGVAATTTRHDHPAGAHAGANPVAVSQLSARQILLDAASTAAAAPARTGKYWHLKIDWPPPPPSAPRPPKPAQPLGGVWQTWYTHEGREYRLLPNQTNVHHVADTCRFVLAGRPLTYGQLKNLPTDPAALKAWITRTSAHTPMHPVSACPQAKPAHVRPAAKPLPPTNVTVASTLSRLLARLPAPPAVRAAAFRALAAMPDVSKAGHADGGVVLAVHGPKIPASKFPSGKAPKSDTGVFKLIIDPATFTLRGVITFGGTMKILAAGWTSHLPTVVHAGKAPTSNSGNG